MGCHVGGLLKTELELQFGVSLVRHRSCPGLVLDFEDPTSYVSADLDCSSVALEWY